MATLKDVAKLANVDVSTVSRALNNTGHVHPETKERIFNAVKELSYHPNLIVKGLREGKKHTIGIVVPRLQFTVFDHLVQAGIKRAAELGYEAIICITNDNEKVEKQSLERLRNGLVDGILIAATGGNLHLLHDLVAQGIQVVQVIRRQDGEISSIVSDYRKAGSLGTRFLYEKGCRNIGLINGSLDLHPYRERYSGYMREAKELGLREIVIKGSGEPNSYEYGYDCARRLLEKEKKLDGILASVDIQGLGAIRAVKDAGKVLGRDIKVMSLTGNKVGDCLETRMTSIEIPAYEIGEAGCELLIRQIEADKKLSLQNMIYDCSLVERETTGEV